MNAPSSVVTYTLEEAAQILKVSYATVYRMTQNGALDCLHIGERPVIRVTHAQLAAYLGVDVYTLMATIKNDDRNASDMMAEAVSLPSLPTRFSISANGDAKSSANRDRLTYEQAERMIAWLLHDPQTSTFTVTKAPDTT